ncbi:MAG TPA: winged helix-turn-helix domain-containing protein [Acidobacteriaceae bacterium]|nr:winged helix-turn-helix domain-containing protein [Acidobacteriaceae bacterium]
MSDEGVVRFGDGFELDRAAYELRRSGRPLRLERIPMETLLLLVERRGQLVSREEIIARVWGKDVFLDTDTSINSAIRKIRLALRDDPENPTFIQTLTGKGYRFIAPVALAEPPHSTPTPVPPSEVPISQPASPGQEPTRSQEQPSRARIRPKGWAVWTALGAVVLAVAGSTAWRLRTSGPTLPPMSNPIPLTTYRGSQNAPSFSPDGNQVAFQWNGEKGDNFDIYVKSLSPDATPLRLTTDPSPDFLPAWSPDGTTIAFQREITPGKLDLMLIPALGGPERKLAEFPARVELAELRPCWTPNNKWIIVPALIGDNIALFRVSVETGDSTQITTPEGGMEDLFPSISPDGKELLYTRSHKLYLQGDLYQVGLDADAKPVEIPRRIVEAEKEVGLSSPVWSQDGKQIFARTLIGAIRMPADGSSPPTPIPWVGASPNWLEVSRSGNRLAYSIQRGDANIYRIDLKARVPVPEALVASTDRDVYPQYSPDGSRLAYYSYRTGLGQIWLGDSEGRQARQLTFVQKGQAATPHWSPDGKTLAIDSNITGFSQIYTISPDGGKMKQLTEGPYANFATVWSRDGRWMYFTSTRTGEEQIWKMPNGGGPAVQITHNGGVGAVESFDSKTLYYGKETGAGSLWKMPIAGGPEVQIADSLYRFNFAVSQRGIYYMTAPDFSHRSELRFYNFATSATSTILQIGIPEFGLDVSPDGRYLVYAQRDDPGSVLMLIENFH